MALPQPQQFNQPNLNRGLGSVANDNSIVPASNDNTAHQNDIANRLAADRARSAAQQNRVSNSQATPFSTPNSNNEEDLAQPDDEAPYDDYNLTEGEGADEDGQSIEQAMLEAQQRQAAAAAMSSAAAQLQSQLTEEEQQERATTMEAQKQAMLAELAKRRMQLDTEIDQLVKHLQNFKDSKAKKFISFFKPNITFIIDELIDILKKQITNLSYRKRLLFLKGAVLKLNSVLAMLESARFGLAIADAVLTLTRWIVATIATIVIPILLFILGFFIVPFTAMIYYIGKIPMLKGKMTDQVIEMIKKIKKQRAVWQEQINTLKATIETQDERTINERKRRQLQKLQTAATKRT